MEKVKINTHKKTNLYIQKDGGKERDKKNTLLLFHALDGISGTDRVELLSFFSTIFP